MKTPKLFRNGQSQAVRLPKEFGLEGDEVYVGHVAGGVLLLPKKITYQQVMHPWQVPRADQAQPAQESGAKLTMTWMFDTNTVICLANRRAG